MIRADRVLSTPPLNTSVSSRRSFVIQAAVAAAGGALLGGTLPLPGPRVVIAHKPDPIITAIEAHRQAIACTNQAIDAEMDLEESLPFDLRRSFITSWSEQIVETDDPRWPAANRACVQAWKSVEALAGALLHTKPATVAGVEALLRHFAEEKDDFFPEKSNSDDGLTGSFASRLTRHAANALHEIALPSAT